MCEFRNSRFEIQYPKYLDIEFRISNFRYQQIKRTLFKNYEDYFDQNGIALGNKKVAYYQTSNIIEPYTFKFKHSPLSWLPGAVYKQTSIPIVLNYLLFSCIYSF
jgi:hypothetical protein